MASNLICHINFISYFQITQIHDTVHVLIFKATQNYHLRLKCQRHYVFAINYRKNITLFLWGPSIMVAFWRKDPSARRIFWLFHFSLFNRTLYKEQGKQKKLEIKHGEVTMLCGLLLKLWHTVPSQNYSCDSYMVVILIYRNSMENIWQRITS